jgi:hypothetical protein
MSDYIKWIRSKVGHDTITLNFSAAIIANEKAKYYYKREVIKRMFGNF